MIQVEKFYCCSLKTASITFAAIILALEVFSLISALLNKTEVVKVVCMFCVEGEFFEKYDHNLLKCRDHHAVLGRLELHLRSG